MSDLAIPTGYGMMTWSIGGPNDHVCQFSLGVTLDVPTTPAEAATAAGEIADVFAQAMSSDYTFDSVRITIGNDAGPPYLIQDFDLSNNGVVSGDSSAPQVSMLFTKSTLTAGRPGRGRLYLPGLVESQVSSNGAIGSTQVDRMIDVAAAMTTVADDVDHIAGLFILHRLDADVTVPSEITQWSFSSVCATQRRRLVR